MKERTFCSEQEGMRKDVKLAFGVLVALFHILAKKARLWFWDDIVNFMKE